MNSLRTRAVRKAARVPMPGSDMPQRQAVADDEIARRAYALYEQRNCADGHDVDDWLCAEQEVRGASPATSA